MRGYKWFSVLLLVILFSCGGDIEIVEQKNEEGKIVERFQRRKSDFAKQGFYEKFSPEGVKIEEATFENDTLDGKRIIFYENGNAQYIENYNHGQFEGAYLAYFENGKLKLEGNYENGAMKGEWKAYYDNSQLKEIVNFENNEENGPFVEYHENGKLKAEGSYLEGDKEHGELKLYDENGELMRRMMCDRGICSTVWQRDSTEKAE